MSLIREFLVPLVIILVVVWIFRYFQNELNSTKRKRMRSLANKLPGPPALPLIGNALQFACKPEEFLNRIVQVLAPFVDSTPMKIWMGPTLYVIVTEPQDIEVILNSKQATQKGYAYRFLNPFIGDGLISGSGKTWKLHRKLVSHTLSQKVLDSFIETFVRHGEVLVENLKCLADGRLFDILHPIEDCTVDIICETVMGCADIRKDGAFGKEFLDNTAAIYEVIHNRMMKIWMYPELIFRLTAEYRQQCKSQRMISDFSKKCVDCVKQKRMNESKSDERKSILERLLELNELNQEMNEEELRSEIYTVYVASQDTMAVVSSFVCLMLAIHPEIQEKARKEAQSVDKIDVESLQNLKYIEMIIKETLRLFPIAPLMVRRLLGDLPLETCTLPEDCQVVILSFATQRNPRYWKEPEKFIPERFTPEEISKRHPYTFFPFSGGPMGCIGSRFAMMSLRTMIAIILRNYTLTTTVRMEDIKLKTDISIRSINGYKVSLQPVK